MPILLHDANLQGSQLVPNSSSPSSRSGSSEDTESSSILGIWRLGQVLHRSEHAETSVAQPADAKGSPRWDYVLKRTACPGNPIEARRQVGQFVTATSSTTHPNLVPILDASTSSAQPYLVMPRLQGITMQEHLSGSAPIPLPVALWMVRQTSQALEALHNSGWIHGDVKPSNVMVGSRGHATLIDLGFASRVHSAFSHHYRGTPGYSAPEMISGQLAAMPSMDIFSLGRMLWQWLTRIEEAPESMLEPVADLVEAMVSQDPSDRPSANAVARKLLQLEIETLGRHIGPIQNRRAA